MQHSLLQHFTRSKQSASKPLALCLVLLLLCSQVFAASHVHLEHEPSDGHFFADLAASDEVESELAGHLSDCSVCQLSDQFKSSSLTVASFDELNTASQLYPTCLHAAYVARLFSINNRSPPKIHS